MGMKIGLLIIGNEILEGKIADLNTRALALFLRGLNLELETSLVVHDSEAAIHHGLSNLFASCNLVVTSGGLGPTQDDVTKDALASFWNRKISYSEESFQVAIKNYARFSRPFAGKEHGYCFLPEGFIPLDNSTGFAPGLFAEHLGKYLLCGPGVPREFKSLLEDHFANLVMSRFPSSSEVIESYTVRTKRIPEETIFGQVDTTLWDKLAAFGSVSSLPNLLGVDIGVRIVASSKSELEDKKKQLHDIFMNSPVSSAIWQIGQKPVEELIVEIANKKNITYGFAESCTGGLCSHRVTNISGSSQTFLGSVVSYAESVKSSALGVSEKTLSRFGAVSPETAAEMSAGLAEKLEVDIAISVTGLAGPGGGSEEKPVGTACFGITCKGQTVTHQLQLFGDREQLKLRFSQAALFFLLEELEKSS